MPKNGYIINKSNYSYRKLHAVTNNGKVYVRDFMTTNNLGGWDSGSIPNTENGFKLVRPNTYNSQRSHSYGGWLLNENNSEEWTINDGAAKPTVTSESEIRLKPNYSSLLDFAYFGSCQELLRASIKNIIANFPAELCFTGKKISYDYVNGREIFMGEDEFQYEVKNPFFIDIFTKFLGTEDREGKNLLRYMYLSAGRYFVYIESGDTLINCGCVSGLITVGNDEFCGIFEDGIWDFETTFIFDVQNVKVRRYYYKTKPYYISDYSGKLHIRPCQEEVDAYFNGLDDFEKMLMDTSTNPKFTLKIDYPHEGEDGFIYTYKRTLTWPLVDSWNIDITSPLYNQYLEALLALCEFYDERNTDNMWRMMTHDSLKNMDKTFSKENSGEYEEDYEYGITKLKSLIRCYGRQFDEIKRYIDNIRFTNNVTYDEFNNLPDYFLTDALNMDGWEVTSAVKGIKSGETVSDLFPGKDGKYDKNDANLIFLRNLKLDSRSIFSRKGTKYGIEMILGLFGYRSDTFTNALNGTTGKTGDYSIEETTWVGRYRGSAVTAYDTLPIEEYNTYRDDYVEYTEEVVNLDTLSGLPAIIYEYDVNGETYKTVIPWFKDPSELDGSPYFQMYGGWGKVVESAGTDSEHYTETLRYLQIVTNLDELTKINGILGGEIVYVYNVGGEVEHYYTITKENAKYSYLVGTHGQVTGWEPITDSGDTRILYIESIYDNYEGNNPHIGYAGYGEDYPYRYDDGMNYLERFNQLFMGTIEDKKFTDEAYNCETGEVIEEIQAEGFDLSGYTDSMKVWYFYDMSREYNNGSVLALVKMEPKDGKWFAKNSGDTVSEGEYHICQTSYGEYLAGRSYIFSGGTWVEADPETCKKCYCGYDEGETTYLPVGAGFHDENSSLYESNLEAIDVRDGVTESSGNNVFASYSIINTKELVISFHVDSDEERAYIKQSVLPYLYQMVPTTTILSINL